MLPKISKLSIFCLWVLLVFLKSAASQTYGTVDSCSASVSPSSVHRNVDADLTFTVNNTGSSSIVWVKITSPSSTNFFINGVSTDWPNVQYADDSLTIFNGTISPGSNTSFPVNVTTIDSDVAAADWTVTASDDSGGASPTTCSGSLSVAISGEGIPPVISDVAVSDVSQSSVKISWTTNESTTGELKYGTTTDYGTTKTDTNLATSHSFDLTGLSANTTYHFFITTTDAAGNNTTFGDSTFVTSKAATTTTTTVTVAVTSRVTMLVTPTPTPTPLPDQTPPSVVLTTDFSKPYIQSPQIAGQATDNEDVSKIDYSLNNGRDFLPANLKSPGAKTNTFDFLPAVLEDGNYQLKIRAKDSAGNTGFSPVYTLIIDRLPPQVGGNLVSIGPQPLAPDPDGVIFALAGLDQKITLSAVGGPTSIGLFSGQKVFALTKDLDNGLWSGALSFAEPGVYELTANSIDGANNKTERKLNTVVVLDNGRISDGQRGIKDATATLFYFDRITKRFVIWDGRGWGQTNPQKTDGEGRYKLLVPPGTYYLKIQAYGFQTAKTAIFTLDKSLPVNTNFTLQKSKEIKIGPFRFFWPNFKFQELPLTLNSPKVPEGAKMENKPEGTEFPDFNLKYEDQTLNYTFLRGKPAVLTFLNSWSPYASTQLQILDTLTQKTEILVAVVFPQESVSSVAIFKKRGGYNLPIIADPDGTLVIPLNLQSIPTHFFLNQKGIIRKVKSGVLSRDEILENLVN